MDRRYVESGDRVHEGKRRLRQLLRGGVRSPAAQAYLSAASARRRNGGERRRSVCCEALARAFGATRTLVPAPDDLRELHVRPVPQGHSAGVRAEDLRSHADLRPPHLSGADQETGAGGRLLGHTLRRVGAHRDPIPHLAGHFDRKPESRLPALPPGSSARCSPLPFMRAAPGPFEARSRGHPLGHRRR